MIVVTEVAQICFEKGVENFYQCAVMSRGR